MGRSYGYGYARLPAMTAPASKSNTGTIVAVALPRIIVALHLDLTDAQWISSLYSMVFAASLRTLGRLADRFGRRRVLALGLIVFTLASLVAARADSGQACAPFPTSYCFELIQGCRSRHSANKGQFH